METNGMNDERKLINDKINAWKAQIKEHGHDILISTCEGRLTASFGCTIYTIARVPYFNAMGQVDAFRKYFLLTIQLTDGNIIDTAVSISFSTLFDLMQKDIYSDVHVPTVEDLMNETAAKMAYEHGEY